MQSAIALARPLKMAADNKPQAGMNIAGHVIRWSQALNKAIGREQVRKAEHLQRLKKSKAANKNAGLPPPKKEPFGTRLTHFDMCVATTFWSFTREGLEFFAAARLLAFTLNCSTNAVQMSLARQVKAGWLLEVAETERDKSMRGRPAKRYRIPDIFPDDVSANDHDILPTADGNNPKTVLPTEDGEKNYVESGFLPTVDGRLLPMTVGANSKSVRGQTPKASVQSDQGDQNHDGESDIGDDDNGDMDTHERVPSPITASDSYQHTEADLELDRIYDGEVVGDCEDLDPDQVQELTQADLDALHAEEQAAARYHDDAGQKAWAAVSRGVLQFCDDFDDVAVFLTMYPKDWPSDDLIHAFAEVANAMPAKWRAGSLWMLQSILQDDPDGEEYCVKAYAKVMAAVADLASRMDGHMMAQPADMRVGAAHV